MAALGAASWQRRALSALLLAICVCVLVWNLPNGASRRRLLPVVRPLVSLLGLQQGWTVFSPDPPRHSLLLDVRVDFEDGSSSTHTLPGSDPFLGALRDYRWRKWVSRVTQQKRQHLWAAAAAWFARGHTAEGRAVRSVVLTRRVSRSPPAGAEREWQAAEFFEWVRLPHQGGD